MRSVARYSACAARCPDSGFTTSGAELLSSTWDITAFVMAISGTGSFAFFPLGRPMADLSSHSRNTRNLHSKVALTRSTLRTSQMRKAMETTCGGSDPSLPRHVRGDVSGSHGLVLFAHWNGELSACASWRAGFSGVAAGGSSSAALSTLISANIDCERCSSPTLVLRATTRKLMFQRIHIEASATITQNSKSFVSQRLPGSSRDMTADTRNDTVISTQKAWHETT
mmetsp:Transcript_29000/g.77410  ORF Transcript_29000/g.77410 Transcript_29000/m.77410 type:complete len:226 (+) Transcript_29000:1103-1780(+)